MILWKTVAHLRHPEPVSGKLVMLLAEAGILINGVTAWLFHRGQKGDVNVRGTVVYFTGWRWVDTVIAFALLGVIVYGSWELLCETLQLSLDAVRAFLLAQPVTQVHDLHVWPLSTTDTALTAHLVRLEALQRALRAEFAISHCTVQAKWLTAILGEHGACDQHVLEAAR